MPIGDRQLVHRDEATAEVGRRHLRGVQRCRHGRHTDPEPDGQSPDDEHGRSGGERLERRADDEQRSGGDDRDAPAQLVGEHAGDERAEQRAERDPARDDLDERGADVELALDAVQCTGDDALVVAEQQAGEHDDDADAVCSSLSRLSIVIAL